MPVKNVGKSKISFLLDSGASDPTYESGFVDEPRSLNPPSIINVAKDDESHVANMTGTICMDLVRINSRLQ